MPASVAVASDEASKRVPGPTTDRPGVSRRGGAGGEGSRSCDGAATAWNGMHPGSCGESRGRGKQVRRGGLARRRGERASSWTTHLGVSMSTIVLAALPHTPQRTWSRVGSRGPILSKVNTPLRIVHSQPHIAPTPVTLARAIYVNDHSCYSSSANAAQACNARTRAPAAARARSCGPFARAATTCAIASRIFPSVVKFSKIKL